MRLLDRYISREVFSHALLGLVIFTFVLFVPQLVRLMELVVRHSAGPGTVFKLVLCTLPGVLTFTVPMAVLVGVLLGLGRLSADSETIALHALGIGLRRFLYPVVALAGLAAVVTFAMTNYLGPLGLRNFRLMEDELRATQASFEVQPRVFDERFPKIVLYIQDVLATASRWRGLLLAETASENGARLTLASEAIVVPGEDPGKFQLTLRNGSTHEYSPLEPNRYSISAFGQSDVPVTVAHPGAPRRREPGLGERRAGELLGTEGPAQGEARVEFHRRLALPAACLVFALAGVPMGARPRRGGRAIGSLLTLLLICGYYLLFVLGTGMARRGVLPPLLGLWAANLITTLFALVWLPHMEEIRGDGWLPALKEWFAALRLRFRSKAAAAHITVPARLEDTPWRTLHASTFTRFGRALGFPLTLDLYLLRGFFGSLLLMLLAFAFLFHLFTFFELLNDMARNQIPVSTVLSYLMFLTPHLLYQVMPLGALVAVLVTLGVLAKNNEVTAFKAGGTSMYRLGLPLLVAGGALGLLMFWLDASVLPFSNQKQDALRNQIKGRPAQTFFQPRRQWIFGTEAKLFNYDWFDSDQGIFGGLSMFVLDPETFHMRRRVFAVRAHWEPRNRSWILEDGWVRDFAADRVARYTKFTVITLNEFTEPPDYFRREVRQAYQMNWWELQTYIVGLQQAGFDVARLTVHLHRKFAFPLLSLIIVFLGIPFAFLVGTRGALGGIAAAIAIGIVYWAASALFEALGAVGQLPPLLAAWAPDLIFAFLGTYFFLKMPT
jgi:LPS export ABC transporter permease LptF/LPS export ABC transporter permease LptG